MNSVNVVVAMKMRDLLHITVIWGQMIIRVVTITRGGSVELIIDISIRRSVSLAGVVVCRADHHSAEFNVLCA